MQTPPRTFRFPGRLATTFVSHASGHHVLRRSASRNRRTAVVSPGADRRPGRVIRDSTARRNSLDAAVETVRRRRTGRRAAAIRRRSASSHSCVVEVAALVAHSATKPSYSSSPGSRRRWCASWARGRLSCFSTLPRLRSGCHWMFFALLGRPGRCGPRNRKRMSGLVRGCLPAVGLAASMGPRDRSDPHRTVSLKARRRGKSACPHRRPGRRSTS